MNNFHDQKNPWRKEWWGTPLAVFCVIAVASATAGASHAVADDPKLNLTEQVAEPESTNENKETPENENTDGDLAVGDSFDGGVWTYTVFGARETDRIDELGDEIFVAEAGPDEKFVIVDFGIKNATDESQEFFGILIDYKIRADNGLTFSPDIEAELALNQPIAEGKIAPGLENRGDVAFKVPKDATGLKFDVSEEPGAIWRLQEPKADDKGEFDPQKLDRIYDSVRIGMTEDEVREVVGEPTAINEIDVESFDHVKSLIYSEEVSTSLNDVTVVLHKGKVRLVLLQEFVEGTKKVIKAKT